ncbi:hypothetical protein KP509_14G040000 [Ceratopteris richardii]|uniref:Core Histone H2A/H2B/H3 domain-containing protein n=1 Tax=Ceratopteris richardii TaxID=49495 RepID=A0A8T2TCC9_CERRI|nr:hypothetical protein KP509_14G040000 [Ceratopteris richardii]
MAETTEELPRTIVRRLVKGKVAELTKDMTEKREIALHKEAIVAFSESAKVFIHYLSATANDICKDAKRQIISADDVLKAIEEIEFVEFLEPLRASLEEFRRDNAIKKSEAKEKGQAKKRKSDVGDVQQNEEAAGKVLAQDISEAGPLVSKEAATSPSKAEKENESREDVMEDA